MAEDIVPALLKTINEQFDLKTKQSAIIRKALKAAKGNKATYLDANKFAIEIGEILGSVLTNNISSAVLPDGKMYYNIGQRILGSTLKKNHDLITGFTTDVQSQLNKKAGIGLKVQTPPFNADRVAGIVNRLDSEPNFDDVAWLLKEPVVNFSQSVVDDSIKANVEFQAKAGLRPTITRRLVGKGCKWCRNLAGVYEYPDVPHDIYRRHENDRCIVEYDPGSGKRQDVWSKKWRDPEKQAQAAERLAKGTGKKPLHPNRKKQYRQASQKMLSESKRYIKKLPKEQYDALRTYTGDSFAAINRHFRSGSKLGKKLLSVPDNLDKALAHEIGQDVKVFRGMAKIPESWLTSMDAETSKRIKRIAGQVSRGTLKPSQITALNDSLHELTEFQVEEKAYISTTYAERTAKKFSSNIRLDLNVPREAHGLAVESASEYASESEILLARGAKIKIAGIQVSENGKTLIVKGEVLNE